MVKGGGHVSQGKKAVSQSCDLKRQLHLAASSTLLKTYSLFTDVYHVPLDRLDLISFNTYNPPIRIDF